MCPKPNTLCYFSLTEIHSPYEKMAFDFVRNQNGAALVYCYEDSRCDPLQSDGLRSANSRKKNTEDVLAMLQKLEKQEENKEVR